MNGILVIISAPSGGGKTSVVESLLTRLSQAVRFPTTTTRSPRPTERPGVDYNFITRAEFTDKIARGDFVEYETYANNLYGTDRALLMDMLQKNRFVFATIDVRGKKSLSALAVSQISFFLEPDSLATLEERINRRPDATPEDTTRRLAVAKQEIAQADAYDYRIVNANGRFDETVAQIKAILDKISSAG